jgi:hypothetical protein
MNTQTTEQAASNLRRELRQRYGPFIRMAPLDEAIWLRFLAQGGHIYAPFTYDVRVGDGQIMPPGTDAKTRQVAYDLSTKRIDVIGVSGKRPLIIEVKQRAGLGCVGQLLGYKQLFDETPGITTSSLMMVVTDVLQPDMIQILNQNNIAFVEVGY